MIEFGLKHKGSSGWKKKFPRKEIEKGDFKHLSMHDHFKFGYDRNYNDGWLSFNDLRHFIKANVGRNVDTVFSEYVRRAKRFDHYVNLKKKFYDALDPLHRWKSDYIIDSQNKIVKIKEEKDKRITAKQAMLYNEQHYPSNMKPYLKENQLVPFKEFYFRTHWYGPWEKKLVYICSKDWYDTVLSIGVGKQFVRMYNMQKVYIPFIKDNAYGVPKTGVENRDIPTGKFYCSDRFDISWQRYKKVQFPYSIGKDTDYIFLVKGDFKQL